MTQTAAITLSEAQFQATVIAMAEAHGWLWWHDNDPRRNRGGLPDLILVHPGKRKVLWRELKVPGGRVRPKQKLWRNVLEAAGADVSIWRPEDIGNGHILADLIATPVQRAASIGMGVLQR